MTPITTTKVFLCGMSCCCQFSFVVSEMPYIHLLGFPLFESSDFSSLLFAGLALLFAPPPPFTAGPLYSPKHLYVLYDTGGQIFFFFFSFLGSHPRHMEVPRHTEGSSQAGGLIAASAAGLRHSHSNAGSELNLWLTLKLIARSLTH